MNDAQTVAKKAVRALYSAISEADKALGKAGELAEGLDREAGIAAADHAQIERLTLHLIGSHPGAFPREYAGNVAGAVIAELERQQRVIEELSGKRDEVARIALYLREHHPEAYPRKYGDKTVASAVIDELIRQRHQIANLTEENEELRAHQTREPSPPTEEEFLEALDALEIPALTAAIADGWEPASIGGFIRVHGGFIGHFVLPDGLRSEQIAARAERLARGLGRDPKEVRVTAKTVRHFLIEIFDEGSTA